MILSEKPKTYVTTVRVDLRDIAKIALFIKDNNFQMGSKSKSKLVAMATQLIGEQLKDYKVDMTEDAVSILRSLGYGESLVDGRRDFKPLLKQMSKENLDWGTASNGCASDDNYDSDSMTTCAEARKKKQDATMPSDADLEAAKSIIATEEEARPEARPEAGPEPEPEPEQLKTRTATDEQKDINRFKKNLGMIPKEVISDE